MIPRRSVIPIFIPHLGCPCRCVFCNQHSITASSTASLNASSNASDSPGRLKSPTDISASEKAPSAADVPGMIEAGLEHAGNGAELAFYGGSFTAINGNLRRAYLEAAAPFVKSGRISSVRISTRPDAIDDAILDELIGYGVRTIELGAQSMNDRVLFISERGHTAEDTVRASRLIKARGFALILQMMVGLPGEEPGDPMRSAEIIASLKPEGVRIYPVAVIKNTELEHMWAQGKYDPLSLDEAVDICSELITFFESEGITVIRAGLNPSEDLEGEIAAGVYHPAFGELCRSKIMLDKARGILSAKSVPAGSTVVFGVDRGKISVFIGQHRHNIEALKKEYGLKDIKVRECEKTASDPDRYGSDKVFVEILDIY